LLAFILKISNGVSNFFLKQLSPHASYIKAVWPEQRQAQEATAKTRLISGVLNDKIVTAPKIPKAKALPVAE
jgi:hypothetical protein